MMLQYTAIVKSDVCVNAGSINEFLFFVLCDRMCCGLITGSNRGIDGYKAFVKEVCVPRHSVWCFGWDIRHELLCY
jgi:hypothetical protein